jgi:hypothetical protein
MDAIVRRYGRVKFASPALRNLPDVENYGPNKSAGRCSFVEICFGPKHGLGGLELPLFRSERLWKENRKNEEHRSLYLR